MMIHNFTRLNGAKNQSGKEICRDTFYVAEDILLPYHLSRDKIHCHGREEAPR